MDYGFAQRVLQSKQPLIRVIDRYMHEDPENFISFAEGNPGFECMATDKIIEMHEKMVLPSIENGLCGYIMTQISDVGNELNGLFSYDRQVCKVDQEAIKKANQRLAQFYESKC